MTNPTPHGQVPEALRLADEISKAGAFPAYPRAPYEAAAAELRRLHAQVAALTAAPQGVAYAELPEPTPDELRAIARKARDSSGSASDDCGSAAYVLYGWRAAIRASNGQAPATQQAGWKLVPMVPTAAMVDAGCPVGETVDHFDMATAYRSMLAAAPQHSPAAQAAPAGADVRRSDLVPGVMHCAKCKFQLNRVTLCVSDGNAYAGDNKTEPCPNGCGPLWPVTWEQEARNCWKTLEEMHERLQAAPAADYDHGPQSLTVAEAARHVGKWLNERPNHPLDLRDVAMLCAHAQKAPAAGAVAGPDGRMSNELRSLIEGMTVSVDVSTGDHDAGNRYFGTVTEVMDDISDKHGVTLLVQDAKPNFAPTPAAQADSVLEDADPLQGAANWLAEAHGQFGVAVLQGCLMIGYNRAKRLHDAAIAARKQGGAHG